MHGLSEAVMPSLTKEVDCAAPLVMLSPSNESSELADKSIARLSVAFCSRVSKMFWTFLTPSLLAWRTSARPSGSTESRARSSLVRYSSNIRYFFSFLLPWKLETASCSACTLPNIRSTCSTPGCLS
uniref:Uncharacterized protein n=1 Tax=Pyxicephalus adspersus TaxID=30357 RepID=A0AAV2ZI74_PYXAD|nr:TPA: hypothetical protein GDO54_004033 [Pyxicephalus adspersus]